MSSLVIEPGATTTLQDGGRVGAARYGVPRSGPVDPLAHRLAVLLAGAAPMAVGRAVAVEVGPHPCRFAADGGVVTVALAGAGATLEVDGATLDAPLVVRLAPGERCVVRARTWAYAAPAADVEVPRVLGSRSRHPRSGLGPDLSDGAVLALRAARPVPAGRHRAPVLPGGPLLVLPAPQTDLFGDEARATLVSRTFTTTSEVDRMGQRLDGPRLVAGDGHDIVSDGIVAGALQVPGDGRPFVLTADHQTTGGYPKIAVLAPVDLARLTRLPPGTDVTFAWTDVRSARAALVAAVAAIDEAAATAPRPHAHSLARSNLIDGVTDPTSDEERAAGHAP